VPVYEFQAYDVAGAAVRGYLDADSPSAAREYLRGRALHIVDVRESDPNRGTLSRFLWPRFGRTRRLEQAVVVSTHLAALLRAGVPLVEALKAMAEQTDDRKLGAMLRDVCEKVGQGWPLSDAISTHPLYFDGIYTNMVRSGEAAGNLEGVLSQLAVFCRRRLWVVNRVIAALTYPAVVVCIAITVLAVLLTVFVPRIIEVLQAAGRPLPLPTVILMYTSDIVGRYWWAFVVGVAALAVALRWLMTVPKWRHRVDQLLLRLPVFGPLLKKEVIARFASVLAALLRSGISLLDGLGIAERVVGNRVLARALAHIRGRVAEGTSLASSMRADRVFPPTVTAMIVAGEQSGDLADVLQQIADSYNEQIEVATQRAISLLEPLLIVVMATGVGFIVLAILLPILEMSDVL